MRARAGCLSGRTHALLEARDLDARVFGVGPHRRGGDPLRVVREVGVRANAGQAVLGAVARSLGLGEAGVTAKARQGLRGDAAGALDEVDDALVVLAGEGVEVVALDAVDAAEAGGGVEGRLAVSSRFCLL